MKVTSAGKGNDARIVKRHMAAVSVTKNATVKRNGLRNRKTFYVTRPLHFGHLTLSIIYNFVIRICLKTTS